MAEKIKTASRCFGCNLIFKAKHCLSCKMIIWISAVTILALGGYLYFHVKADRKHFTLLIQDQTYLASDIIKRSIREEMLLNDRMDLQKTVNDITGNDEIIKIRLIEKKGNIRVSSDEREIGQVIDKDAEACHDCHIPGQKPKFTADKISRIFTDADGQMVIGMVNPIYNEKACYNCHGEEKKILGTLDVVISLSRMTNHLHMNRNRAVIFLFFTFMLLSVTLILLIRHFIATPVKKLIKGTTMITNGNLDHKISIDTGDEIGKLARSFNVMTSRLKTSRQEIENWNRELEGRVKLATAQLASANEELELANQKLKESDKKKSEIVMVVAHDIRAPLASIKSCLQVVLEGYIKNDPAKEREMLKRVEARVEDQLTFVKNLLDFSRIAESCGEMIRVDLHNIIWKVSDLMSDVAKTKKMSIKVFEQDGQLPLLADEDLLVRALTNLVGNAIKYNPEGSKIWIDSTTSNGNINIAIKDNGVGIPKDEVPNIFEVLFRGRNAKRQKEHGAGLGLSIVKQVVEIHQGKIHVESKEKEGTSFFISLPRAKN